MRRTMVVIRVHFVQHRQDVLTVTAEHSAAVVAAPNVIRARGTVQQQ
jgi:hypothetical protein